MRVFIVRIPSDKDNLVAGDVNYEKEGFVPQDIALPSQPLAKSGFDLDVRFPLPSPKPVEVPEPLRQHYGNVLMVTEFVHFFGNFLYQDGDLKYSPGTVNLLEQNTASVLQKKLLYSVEGNFVIEILII